VLALEKDKKQRDWESYVARQRAAIERLRVDLERQSKEINAYNVRDESTKPMVAENLSIALPDLAAILANLSKDEALRKLMTQIRREIISEVKSGAISQNDVLIETARRQYKANVNAIARVEEALLEPHPPDQW
jgi:6-phosphogluconate dehydrogenase (decarboxylating)